MQESLVAHLVGWQFYAVLFFNTFFDYHHHHTINITCTKGFLLGLETCYVVEWVITRFHRRCHCRRGLRHIQTHGSAWWRHTCWKKDNEWLWYMGMVSMIRMRNHDILFCTGKGFWDGHHADDKNVYQGSYMYSKNLITSVKDQR